MRTSFIIGGLVLAALVIAAVTYWPDAKEWFAQSDAASAQAGSEAVDEQAAQETDSRVSKRREDAATPLPAPETELLPSEPVIELPPLQESDAFVVERAAGWSIPPAWLQQDQLLARLSVLIFNGADGQIPERQLAFLAPTEAPQVVEQDGLLYLAPASFERFDIHMAALESVPVTDAVAFVRLVEPLLQSGLNQLGERRPVRVMIEDLIAEIETAPKPAGQIEVVRPNVLYEFADPALENASELHKQLLRIGPRNYARLMTYVSEFKALYLG
jgi:hypothetical protein